MNSGDHLENIGNMIEEMEIDLRRNIDVCPPPRFFFLIAFQFVVVLVVLLNKMFGGNTFSSYQE